MSTTAVQSSSGTSTGSLFTFLPRHTRLQSNWMRRLQSKPSKATTRISEEVEWSSRYQPSIPPFQNVQKENINSSCPITTDAVHSYICDPRRAGMQSPAMGRTEMRDRQIRRVPCAESASYRSGHASRGSVISERERLRLRKGSGRLVRDVWCREAEFRRRR